MAVGRFYKECEVCSTVTIMRVQAGHLPEYPVRVYCGECHILFSGKILFVEQEASMKLELSNCKNVERDKKASYSIEISGELPTLKLHNTSLGINPENIISPFIRFISTIGNEQYVQYSRLVEYMRSIPKEWPIYRRIYELYLNGKHELLNNEIKKIGQYIPIHLVNEIDYIVSVHQILIRFLAIPLSATDFFEKADQIQASVEKYYSDLSPESNSAAKAFIQYVDGIGIERMKESYLIVLKHL